MLEVKNVTIAVGERVVAEDLSFIANDGELTCITGDAASGKTTLIRTLMGFLPVKAGFVSVDGELLTIYSSHAFREMMVYLPQDAQVLRIPQEETEDELLLLATQTLQESADKPIIIADEPTALLSSEHAYQLMGLLQQQVEQGKTVLVTSRDPLVINRANKVINI